MREKKIKNRKKRKREKERKRERKKERRREKERKTEGEKERRREGEKERKKAREKEIDDKIPFNKKREVWCLDILYIIRKQRINIPGRIQRYPNEKNGRECAHILASKHWVCSVCHYHNPPWVLPRITSK